MKKITERKENHSHKLETSRSNRYTSVFFEDEREWARFLDWVFGKYGQPRGLEFTRDALPMSIQVSQELLEQVHGRFRMKIVTPADIRKHLATLKGDHPFDPRSIEGRHVPGIGYFKPRPRK